MQPFGYLMTIDLYECKIGICDDIAKCYEFLEELVKELKMEKQSPPFIFKSDNQQYPDKAGLSGWIPMIESGIQIHTLSCKDFVSIDIYSCRLFKQEDILDFISSYFTPKKTEINFLERGLSYH